MINPEDAAALGQETSALYAQAELLIIAAITEHIATVGDVPNFVWMEQLRRAQLRGYVQGVANVLAQKSNETVAAAVVEAVELGQKAAVRELTMLGKAAPTLHDSGLLTLAEHHSRGVSTELNRMVAGLGNSANDVMRRIAVNAAADVARGDLSPFDAARKAHTRMAREGYGFFRDKAGRKWGMDTYAEMAVRTSANNAMIEGHTRALTAAGEDFVIVSSHNNPAPQCAPYERKVLSLTGAHRAGSHRVGDSIVSVKATLNEARANGFEHPNCRHTISVYQPGTTPRETPKLDPNHEGYKATQKQRYYEREIRASKRMESAAITDADKTAARSRARAYQGKLREHIREHDLQRRRHREQVRTADWED